MDKGPIVVVVADADLRAFIVYALEHDGYVAHACADPQAGLEAVARIGPALVITDLMLGVSSGLDLISRIRAALPPPRPAILACSGFPGLEDEARRRGADLYLAKPFDLESLRAAVRALLAHRPIASELVERADRESHRLREGAAAAAHAALARLAPHMERVVRHGEWTARWLPRYFGFGRAFIAVQRDGRLAVLSSSDPGWLPRDADVAARLPLCHDVVESLSAVVLPDAAALIPEAGVRFLVGVPLLADSLAIGVLCLVDDQPRNIDGEELALLEAAGRRGSAVLADNQRRTAPFWAGPGLLAHEALLLAMALELRRARHTGELLHLLAFASGRPDSSADWADALDRVAAPRRRVLAALGGDRFALLMIRGEHATPEVTATVQALQAAAAIRGGGLVSMEGVDLVGVAEHEMMALAFAMLDRQLRGRERGIEHVVIRREPWPAPAAPPAP